MPDILRFQPARFDFVGSQVVSWKERWQDAWQAVPELWCSEAVWTCAPSIGTAQLRFRYGDSLTRIASRFLPVFRPRNRLRQYVKISFVVSPINADDLSELVRTWYGILDVELDELHGTFVRTNDQGESITYASGIDHFVAYGLESLLDTTTVKTSLVAGSGANEQPKKVLRGLPFNPKGVGNRAASAGEHGVYAFHAERTGGEKWTTRDCVQYLLAHHTPRDHNDELVLPFEFYDPTEVTPNWDAPQLACEHRTPWTLLNSLLGRQRLLSFRTYVGTSGGNETIRVIPFAFNDQDLTIDEATGATLVANPDQVILAFERDSGARASLKRSTADAYDRVRSVGATRTSTGTFAYGDDTLAIGWPTALETEFEQGGSSAGDFPPAADVQARALRNLRTRQSDKFKPVYQRHVFKPDCQYLVNGITLDETVLMPRDDDEEEPTPHAPEDQRFLTEVALLEGYDYSTDKLGPEGDGPAETGPKPHRHLQPLVLFRREDWTEENPRYKHAENSGIAAADEIDGVGHQSTWSANVRVDEADGALWIEVAAGTQDMIAKTDFSPRPEDLWEIPADFRHMLCTLTVPWSAFAEAHYPDQLPYGRDTIRELTILAGDDYRVDYVLPGTVVGLDPAYGELLRSTTGGYVRDDRPALRALARLAYEWYGVTRRALSFSTSLVNNALEVGMLVVSVGDPDIEGDIHVDDVRSCVTQVRLSMPLAEGEGDVRPEVPRIEYHTAFGELDALQLRLGRPGT